MTESHHILRALSILDSRHRLEVVTIDNFVPTGYNDLLFSFYEEPVTTSSRAAMTSGSSMCTGWDEDQETPIQCSLQSPKGARVDTLLRRLNFIPSTQIHTSSSALLSSVPGSGFWSSQPPVWDSSGIRQS